MFVRINQRVINGGQLKEVWFVFETAHRTMEEIHDALVRDGRLLGTRVDTKADGPHRRVAIDEQDVSLLAETITSVSEMVDDLYDEDGSSLWIMPADEVAG